MRIPLKDTKIKSTPPFLGYVGIGAKFEWVELKNVFVLRETTLSQLVLILMLSTLWIIPLHILFFAMDQIKGGIFGKSILVISILISLPFSFKYLFRWLSNKRIVFSGSSQKIEFYKNGDQIEKSLFFSDCAFIKLDQFNYRSDSLSRSNFGITIHDKQGWEHVICVGHNNKNIETMFESIKLILRLPNITK